MTSNENSIRRTRLFEKITQTPWLRPLKGYTSELDSPIRQTREDILWATYTLHQISKYGFFDISEYQIGLRLGSPAKQREAVNKLRILLYNLYLVLKDEDDYVDYLEKNGITGYFIYYITDLAYSNITFTLKQVVWNEKDGKLVRKREVPKWNTTMKNKSYNVKNNPNKEYYTIYYAENISSWYLYNFIYETLLKYFELEPTEQTFEMSNNPSVLTRNTYTMASNPMFTRSNSATNRRNRIRNFTNNNTTRRKPIAKRFTPQLATNSGNSD